MTSANKKQYGQFFTRNSDYILQGLGKFVKNKKVSDPFAGGSDLLIWAKKHKAKTLKGYDVDSNLVNKSIFLNDSLNNPLEYKFVITNPPYLHKNKASSETKDKYFVGENKNFEDLYQISIKSLIKSEEGIIIVPLNFLSAENSEKIRNIFFEKFEIVKLNIFYERVFEDTTYNVIAFYYRVKSKSSEANKIDATIFPENKKISIVLEKKYGWKMGGEFSDLINNVPNLLGVYRLTESMLREGKNKIELAFNHIKNKKAYFIDDNLEKVLKQNIILLKAIDTKNKEKIKLEDIRKYNVHGLIGKQTSRNMAYLLFRQGIDLKTQEKIIELFNEELQKGREEHLSFFLTNFRDNNRKRISFEFSYKLINYIYVNKIIKENFDHEQLSW